MFIICVHNIKYNTFLSSDFSFQVVNKLSLEIEAIGEKGESMSFYEMVLCTTRNILSTKIIIKHKHHKYRVTKLDNNTAYIPTEFILKSEFSTDSTGVGFTTCDDDIGGEEVVTTSDDDIGAGVGVVTGAWVAIEELIGL